MPRHIQIRDVPTDVHEKLRRNADRKGLSLSEYLRRELADLADRPSLADVLAQAARDGRGGIDARRAAALVREDRDSR